ncbi:hypothetical protein P9112_006477 [Eukaryota sp. TZLM1-RC]
MQQQEQQQDIHTYDQEGNKVAEPDPISPSPKVKNEISNEVPPSSVIEEVTRTDPAPSPLKEKKFLYRGYENGFESLSPQEYRIDHGGNENGPGSLSPPNIELVSKGTDENPTLDTFSPLGEYEEIQSQLDEMEEEDDSSDGVYKLLTRTQSLTSIPWTFIHTSSSLPLWTQHKKSRLHTRLQIETPPPLLLTTMANIRSLLL